MNRRVPRRPNPAKPLLLWHATNRVFDRFDPDRSGLGTHFGTYRAASGRARMAGKHGMRAKESGAWRVTRYRLDIRNPIRMVDLGGWDDEPNMERAMLHYGLMEPRELHATRSLSGAAFWSWVRARIEAEGYDAIVYRNKVEDEGHDSYIVWRNDQIREAPVKRRPVANPARKARRR